MKGIEGAFMTHARLWQILAPITVGASVFVVAVTHAEKENDGVRGPTIEGA
jgi:hypothetical protein